MRSAQHLPHPWNAVLVRAGRKRAWRQVQAAPAALQAPPCPALSRPPEAPALPEEPGSSSDEDDMFTERDWHNVLRGYTSQHVEHDFPIPDSMIEGEALHMQLGPAPHRRACMPPHVAAKASLRHRMVMVTQAGSRNTWKERFCATGPACLTSAAQPSTSPLTATAWCSSLACDITSASSHYYLTLLPHIHAAMPHANCTCCPALVVDALQYVPSQHAHFCQEDNHWRVRRSAPGRSGAGAATSGTASCAPTRSARSRRPGGRCSGAHSPRAIPPAAAGCSTRWTCPSRPSPTQACCTGRGAPTRCMR